MTDAKKIAVLLALLAAASTDAARGQGCVVFADAPRVRVEGTAELAGEIVVRCRAGAAPEADANFRAAVELAGGAVLANRRSGGGEGGGETAGEAVLTVLHDAAPAATAEGVIVNERRLEFTLNKPQADAAAFLTMKIAGIRVNAAAAGKNPIAAHASFGWLPVSNYGEAVVIAQPTAGLRVDVPDGPAVGFQCVVAEAGGTAAVELKEGFAAAFAARGQSSQNIRLMLRFSDFPAGVGVRLPAAPACRSASLKLVLQSGLDANGAGASSPAVADAQGNVRVALREGAGAAVYEVTESISGVVESCRITPSFSWGGGDGTQTGTGRVTAGFAPLSAAAAPRPSAPAPRFDAGAGEARDIVRIDVCSTHLLFPFVTNRAGFSTGVVIANTSRDAFGTKPQAGACAIDYYGGFSEGAPPPSQRSAIVSPGGHLVFTLSAGNEEHSIAPAPDFQGYLVARCDFRYAHGAVLVSDSTGGAPSVMYGYLALVVPHRPGPDKEGTLGVGH